MNHNNNNIHLIYQWWWLCSKLSSQSTLPAALLVAPAGKVICQFYLFVCFLVWLFMTRTLKTRKTVEICWSPLCTPCRANVRMNSAVNRKPAQVLQLSWLSWWSWCWLLSLAQSAPGNHIFMWYILDVIYFGALLERSIKTLYANWKIKWILQPVIVVQWAQQWSPGSCSKRPDCLNIICQFVFITKLFIFQSLYVNFKTEAWIDPFLGTWGRLSQEQQAQDLHHRTWKKWEWCFLWGWGWSWTIDGGSPDVDEASAISDDCSIIVTL